VKTAISFILLFLMPFSASANGCRLALVFALDVSSSISSEEYALQRNGLASALLHPDVSAALLGDGRGSVALAAYEWSGRYQSEVRLNWIEIRDQSDILKAASELARATRSQEKYPTAIGYALGFGAGMLARAPDCRQRKIDVSGDGSNNEGFKPALAFSSFPFGGVTVNGLAIESSEAEIADYYRRNVAYGPGAFVISARDYKDFKRAMTLKLLRELGDMMVSQADTTPKHR